MSESSPLRGRDGESALIGQLLSAAARGGGSIVVIEGPAGFGKTRLLRSPARCTWGRWGQRQ